MRVSWLVCTAATLAGCGLLSGLDDITVTDGGVDAGDSGLLDVSLDIGTTCEAGTCGAPAGFQPVFFALKQDSPCASGASSNDVIVDPTPPATACTCSCNYQPNCFPEPLGYVAGGNTCTTNTATSTTLDGGCNSGTGTPPPSHMAFGPWAPTNPCTNIVTAAGVTSTPGRVCSVANCASCMAPPGFALCFAQTGVAKCPDNMTTHTIGADAKLSCSSCTACTSTAKCRGTLTIYDDNACSFKVGSFQVDGTCNSMTNVNVLGTYKYAPSVDPGTCTPGTSTGSVAISAQTTVCCP